MCAASSYAPDLERDKEDDSEDSEDEECDEEERPEDEDSDEEEMLETTRPTTWAEFIDDAVGHALFHALWMNIRCAKVKMTPKSKRQYFDKEKIVEEIGTSSSKLSLTYLLLSRGTTIIIDVRP